jgi:Sensors of blue-light using FAD
VRLLKQILFFSSANHLFSDDELLELLKIARANNARDGITGMLLYVDGNFVQLIEGPDDAVDRLYAKIGRDPRHSSLLKALDGPIGERRFADWTLGFHQVSGAQIEGVEGLTDFLQQAHDGDPKKPAGQDAAIRLLDTFKRVVRTDFSSRRR